MSHSGLESVNPAQAGTWDLRKSGVGQGLMAMSPYEVGSMTGVWAGNSLNSELLLAAKTASGTAFSSKMPEIRRSGFSPVLFARGGSPGADRLGSGTPRGRAQYPVLAVLGSFRWGEDLDYHAGQAHHLAVGVEAVVVADGAAPG